MIDSGKILFQKTIQIDPLFHFPQLATHLAIEGAMAIMDTIYNIDTIQPIVQVFFPVQFAFRMNRRQPKPPKLQRKWHL